MTSFTNTLVLSAVLVQSILPHNGVDAAAQSQLRGGRRHVSDEVVVSTPSFEETDVAWDRQQRETRGRSLTAVPDTVLVTNNCDRDITHFRGQYNAQWAHVGGGQYTLQSDTTGGLPLARGASLTLTDVTEPDFHFYALHAAYHGGQWHADEVATTLTESDIWTHVTFNGSLRFPWYMEEIGADGRIDLCGPAAETTTTTTTTTTPATTTTAAATTTTTTEATTAVTSTATQAAPEDDDTLTIVNDCDTDITHFRGQYNVAVVRNAETGAWELQSQSTGSLSLRAGETVTLSDVTGDGLHFYALHAAYDRDAQDTAVTEVATRPADEESDNYTHVTFTTSAGNQIQFPFYVETIGDDRTIALCGDAAGAN